MHASIGFEIVSALDESTNHERLRELIFDRAQETLLEDPQQLQRASKPFQV